MKRTPTVRDVHHCVRTTPSTARTKPSNVLRAQMGEVELSEALTRCSSWPCGHASRRCAHLRRGRIAEGVLADWPQPSCTARLQHRGSTGPARRCAAVIKSHAHAPTTRVPTARSTLARVQARRSQPADVAARGVRPADRTAAAVRASLASHSLPFALPAPTPRVAGDTLQGLREFGEAARAVGAGAGACARQKSDVARIAERSDEKNRTP